MTFPLTQRGYVNLIRLLVFDYSEELFDPFGDGDPIVWDNICGRGFLCLSEIKIILLYVLIFGYFRELLAVSVCCYF
jgi:hypothetical protein